MFNLFQKPKSKPEKIAYIISRIFDPFNWLIVLGIVTIGSDYFSAYNRVLWAIGLAVFLGLLPIIAIYTGLRKGKVSDIDFTKKEERTPIILVVLFFWLVGLILTWALSGPRLILVVLLAAMIVGILLLFINFYWKVSNHILGISAASFFINELYSWEYAWIFLLIPIVAWARWVQKKHGLGQLVGGFALGYLFFIILKLFGY